MTMPDDDTPAWPHHQRPTAQPDGALPMEYVVEMTAVGVALNAGPAAVMQAVRARQSPHEFATQITRNRVRRGQSK